MRTTFKILGFFTLFALILVSFASAAPIGPNVFTHGKTTAAWKVKMFNNDGTTNEGTMAFSAKNVIVINIEGVGLGAGLYQLDEKRLTVMLGNTVNTYYYAVISPILISMSDDTSNLTLSYIPKN